MSISEPLAVGARHKTTPVLNREWLPALFTPTSQAANRTLEFFKANIRNPNTRKAYARAMNQFAVWCALNRLEDLAAIEPLHVSAYIEQLQQRLAAPSVKLHLAALRVLFDWLVVGAGDPDEPGELGPETEALIRKGKTPVLRKI